MSATTPTSTFYILAEVSPGVPRPLFSALGTAGPGTGNDGTQGYVPGSQWLDTSNGVLYICKSNGTGAASWLTTQTTAVSLALSALTAGALGVNLELGIGIPVVMDNQSLAAGASITLPFVLTACRGGRVHIFDDQGNRASINLAAGGQTVATVVNEVGTAFTITTAGSTGYGVTVVSNQIVITAGASLAQTNKLGHIPEVIKA